MKVVNIKYVKSVIPETSCGTGYSEPDVFNVIFDNNTSAQINIDIWYRHKSNIKPIFYDTFTHRFGDMCDNIDQAWLMYAREIAEHIFNCSCDELIKQTE